MRFKAYNLGNYLNLPQVQQYLTPEQKHDIRVVGTVLPFKVNQYVIDELIDWKNVPNDPIYTLTFPQKGMLLPHHYNAVSDALNSDMPKEELKTLLYEIRMELNPHPAGQLEHNVPELDGIKLTGVQHKYRETMLFFPAHGQTCHAYCTFCFRWPQFVGMDELKFAMRETELLIEYVKQHPELSDILFTGGDPMVMNTQRLSDYIEPLLDSELSHLQTIRIGTKALSYWPYRFTTDTDADELLRLFEKIVKSGRHVAIMAHFNHYNELKTEAVKEAIARIRNTGAEIRTQSPLMRNINDHPRTWAKMWKLQVKLGCIPYYMFVARDTGAQHYFSVPLHRASQIFRKAYQTVSGVARTVRGPSMSAGPGKVQVLGTAMVGNEKVFVLRFLQGRNPDWVHRPFFAKFDTDAVWLTDLVPAFGEEKFFFEEEYSFFCGNTDEPQQLSMAG
ncbi:MAG: hypothetical protein KIS94_07860 [Chitinophagales bacterium]|nr:hypothetical protein [Chitinophagales bacterium]